jgi:hypothetical protein
MKDGENHNQKRGEAERSLTTPKPYRFTGRHCAKIRADDSGSRGSHLRAVDASDTAAHSSFADEETSR